MAHAQHTVSIDRPIAEVFAFLADGSHNPEWRDGVLEIERTSPVDGLGASYRQVVSGPAGRRIDADYRVTAYEPPSRLDFEVTAGPVRPIGVFELSPEGSDRTTVRFDLTAEPRGLMRAMGPMIGRQVKAEVAQLDRLKTVLETGDR
jgi:uncharacterized protein YndB with AHSA1/START domain